MKLFYIFLCIAAMASAHRSKIHEQMTADEKIYTFGPDNDDAEYDVTPLAYKDHENSADHKILHLTSFNQSMRLYLEPTDGYLAGVNTPVFSAKKNPRMINGVQYERIKDAITSKHKLYQDPFNNAALSITYDPMGLPLINGVINLINQKHSLVIRPLLSRFHHLFQRGKRDAHDDHTLPNRTLQHHGLKYTRHHVVYKVPNEKANKVDDDYVDDGDDDEDYRYEDEEIGVRHNKHEHHHGHEHMPDNQHFVGGDEGHGHIDMVAFHGKKLRSKGNKVLPETVYPQILVIVENGLFKKFQSKVPRMIDYLLAFWNGVDLRYRAYQKPNIRLNIAAIILAMDEKMTPYITDNKVHIKDFKNDKINVTSALRAKAAFMFPETVKNYTDETLTMKRLGVKYDMVITMTTLDMCQLPENCADERTKRYTCDMREVPSLCDTLGYAYFTGAGAYTNDDQYQEMEAVGIIEDTGTFLGVVPTAHEIGHLLGASHDKDNQHGCDWNDGYLMSFQMIPKQKSFIWSNCSAESVKYFMRTEDRAKCMFDKPNTGNKLPRKLPGQVFTRGEICDRAIGSRPCTEEFYANHCSILYCQPRYISGYNRCENVKNHLVPEGAFCGDGKFCLNGLCVNETDANVHLTLGTTRTTTLEPMTTRAAVRQVPEEVMEDEIMAGDFDDGNQD